MAKRKYSWTEDKIARYYKDGRGSGELANYKPWLTVQDVPSSGRVHRINGWKTSRIHHLLSDLELSYFYHLEWTDKVIDIREQYPLNREITFQIAERKQIEHPVDHTTRTPLLLTTDFFVTLRNNNNITYIARTVKPSDKLNDPRVIEKFELEREYWMDKQIDWGIVTEKDLSNEVVKNIAWFHSAYKLPDTSELELLPELYSFIEQNNNSISKSLRQFDSLYCLKEGRALSLFKHLIANKNIMFDLRERFNIAGPTSSLKLLGLSSNERRLVT
jgi:hypothetical protein